MTVRQGRRYVRIFSPMSLLAIGIVACSAGLVFLFSTRVLPEDLLAREFATASFYAGFYFLSFGVPAVFGFATKVVNSPRETGKQSSPSFDSLLGFYIVATSTVGFLALGLWLIFSQTDYFAIGVALCLFALLDALVLVPLWLFLRSERA